MKRSNSSQSSFYQVGSKALALFVSFVLITTMILPTTLVFADERQRDTSQEQSQSYSSAHSYNHADTPDGSHDGVSNQNESTVTGIDQNDSEKSGDSKPSGTSSGSNAGGSAPNTTGGDTATGSDDSLTNTMGDIQTASDVTNLLSASSVAPSSNDANNTAQANNNDTAQSLADDANCYCAYTCEDGLVRQDCPVCKFDASKCKGTHKRVCSCEVACVPDATGKCASADGCPVCEIDPTRCIATEPRRSAFVRSSIRFAAPMLLGMLAYLKTMFPLAQYVAQIRRNARGIPLLQLKGTVFVSLTTISVRERPTLFARYV